MFNAENCEYTQINVGGYSASAEAESISYQSTV
jgi:hypothetical protein